MPIFTILPILAIFAMGLLIASFVVLYMFVKELRGEDEDEEDD